MIAEIAAHVADINTLVSLARASNTWYDDVEAQWTLSASVPGHRLIRPAPFKVGDDLGVASFDAIAKDGHLVRLTLGERTAAEAAERYGRVSSLSWEDRDLCRDMPGLQLIFPGTLYDFRISARSVDLVDEDQAKAKSV